MSKNSKDKIPIYQVSAEVFSVLEHGQASRKTMLEQKLIDFPADIRQITAAASDWKTGKTESILSAPEVSESKDDTIILPNTPGAIGSVTKMFTSAAMNVLWDRELSHSNAKQEATSRDGYPKKTGWFPEGIETRLSHFVPALREKYSDNTFLQNIHTVDSYAHLTIRDLLSHTHGMGDLNVYKTFEDQVHLQQPTGKVDLSKDLDGNAVVRTDKSRYQQYDYSNFGYVLAGMIIETVANKPFCEVIRESVIGHLSLKNTHMSDQLPVLRLKGYERDQNDELRSCGHSI